MEEIKKFGLIGKNISYSFSKKYFEEKFKKLFLKNYEYGIFHLDNILEIESLLKNNIRGLNVTIPYKTQIINYLDELSEEAEKIGAVNCVSISENKKIGYNTDAFGFERTLQIHRKNFQNSAIILGDGGAAKAVKYVFEKLGISYKTVSRKSAINFDNLTHELVSDNLIIVQCTPVGTFPNVKDCVTFPFHALTEKHLVIDLIYNPNITEFLNQSSKKGAKTVNGYYMLEQQAEKSWEIWNYR